MSKYDMLESDLHPIIVEFRKVKNEKMPDFLDLLLYLNWEDGEYAEEIRKLANRVGNIQNLLQQIHFKKEKSSLTEQSYLKEQLMGLFLQMETIYRDLTSKFCEKDWAAFNKFKSSNAHDN